MITELVPTIECLADETVLIQAWKKASKHIRYHNWFSDTLELDRTAVNLREFIASLSVEIKSGRPIQSDPIRMVPAPKNQAWKIDGSGLWNPIGIQGDASKTRPLAHVSLRDQVIATAIMMCLADRFETRQGDPATPLESGDLQKVVSYGNRLYCDFQDKQARLRWGSGTLYRGFYEDYQTFLARPELVAEGLQGEGSSVLIVQSDLRQFYDRVSPELFRKQMDKLRKKDDEAAFFDLAINFLKWTWSPKDHSEVNIYAKQSGISDFSTTVLPQGLVAAGFFANIALSDFDEMLRGQIGEEVLPGVELEDAIRYVDDLRFVMSTPSHTSVEEIQTKVFPWIEACLEETALGLKPAEEKTQISTFRSDERPLVQQSKRMARINAAISGGFDPVAGGEILDSVLALVRAQERISKSEIEKEHSPFRLVPDVRDATVDRFVAGRFRTTFRSLRPQLWLTQEDLEAEGGKEELSQFKGVRTRGELDDETRAFSIELISKWASDPSNVRLLRIALDLWPDAEVLDRVLILLRRFTQKGGPRKAPRRIAWYCLAEILRAGAVETGFVADDEQLPSAVNVEKYREVLREEAVRIVGVTETRLPWYLKQQAYLFLATNPPDTQSLPSHAAGDLAPYARLIRFLKGSLVSWHADEFATNAVLARRSYLNAKRAADLVGKQLTPARLNRIATLDPNFAFELANATGSTPALSPRIRADLGISEHSDAKPNSLAQIVLNSAQGEQLRTERALLSFSAKFLRDLNSKPDVEAVSPSEVLLSLDRGLLEVSSVEINPRKFVGTSLYEPPSWTPINERWRFMLGFLLRFILTAQPDFTRSANNSSWKEEKQIYRQPGGQWYERIYGFYSGHSAFGDDWLPISDWMERLLFGLLRWPGCDQTLEAPVVGALDGVLNVIEERLLYLQGLQGTSAALLPLVAPGGFQKSGEPLRACVVQLVFPSQEDFPSDDDVLQGKVTKEDLSMSSPSFRVRQRRHLSAALAAVKATLALRETHKGMKNRLDWLILPELAVHPDDVQTHLIPFARAHKTIILAGLTYEELFLGRPLVNSAVWVLPTRQQNRGLQVLRRRQGKKHLAPNERSFERAGLVQSFRPCQWLIGYEWSNSSVDEPLWLTAAVCFDATDIKLAADLRERSDVFAIPALNRDVKTFDNMALALHYHMHQAVVVANNGEYGGSNAYAPYSDGFKRQIFHVHGQPQASIAFFEIDDVEEFKKRGDSNKAFKPQPAGM